MSTKITIDIDKLKKEADNLCGKINKVMKSVKDTVEDRHEALKPFEDDLEKLFNKVKDIEGEKAEVIKEEIQKTVREAIDGPPLTPAEMKEIDLDVERAIIELIKHKPFFGFILSKITRNRSELVPTMGVAPSRNNKIMLVYNPKFYKRLPKTERLAVLEHEVMHILNEHFLRQKNKERERWNMACDIAINQYIEGLPECALKVPEKLEEKRESEYYYNSEEVRKMAADSKWQQLKGLVGDHEAWKKIASTNAAEIESAIRDLVKGAYEEAKDRDRGSIPAWLEEMVQRIINKPIRWQNMIRRYICQEISPQQDITYRRPHRRRMNDIFPGFRREPQSRVTVALDTSGSMSPEDLGEVVNELFYLKKQHSEVELIQCDTEITKVEKFDGKNELKCHGRGGTCFKPVLDYMAKKPVREGLKPTLVYFTDGYGENPSDEGYSKRFNVIWVINRNGSTSRVAQFGRIIKMEEHRRG